MVQVNTINNDTFNHAQLISYRLNEYTSLLKEYMGVLLFGYMKILPNSMYIYSGSSFSFTRVILEICTKVKGIVFYNSVLGKENSRYVVSWPKMFNHNLIDIFRRFNYWNGISVIEFQDNETEIFSFVSDLDNQEICNFYVKHYSNFIKFSKYFASKNADILKANNTSSLCLEQNTLFNFKSDIKSQFKKEQLRTKRFFDCILKPEFTLSDQEYRCIQLLAKGRTMKEAGRILAISPRTVEGYIENIKGKTNCNFKSQILDLFFDDRLTTKAVL